MRDDGPGRTRCAWWECCCLEDEGELQGTESAINLNEPEWEFSPESPGKNTATLFQWFETQSIESSHAFLDF